MRRVWVFLLTLVLLAFQAVPALADRGIRVFVDGTEVQADVAPFIHEGRTLVPLRALGEALGFAVDYDGAERRITLARGETTLVLWVDSTRVLVNGREATIDVPALVRSGRTFVPVRFVAEQLGAVVEWDGVQVKVTRPKPDVTAPAEPVAEKPPAEPAQPATDPEAWALLEKIQVPDAKLTGWLETETVFTDSDEVMVSYYDIHGHLYQGDMLITMTVQEAEDETLEYIMAGRDGVTYLYDPMSETWEVAGVDDSLDLSQLSEAASVTIRGTETIDGITTTRLDVRFAPETVNRVIAKGGLGWPGLDEAVSEVTYNWYNLSLWADEDGQVRKIAVDLSMTTVFTNPEGGPVTQTTSRKGEFRFVPVSEPIVWPESLEAYLQS